MLGMHQEYDFETEKYGRIKLKDIPGWDGAQRREQGPQTKNRTWFGYFSGKRPARPAEQQPTGVAGDDIVTLNVDEFLQ